MPPERGEATGQRGSDASDPRRRRLAELAESLGETVATAGNQPVRLDDPESVWFVERGVLDIFFVYAEGGIAEAPFHHALRLEEGRLAFGAGGTEETWLMAKGLPGTALRRIPAAELAAGTGDDASALRDVLAEDADNWIAGISATVASEIVPRPRPDTLLSEGDRVEAEGVLTSAGGVAWVQGAGPLLFGTENPEEGEMVPITPESWAVLHAPAEVAVLPSRALGADTLLSRALPGFHRLAFGAEGFNRRLALVDQANLQVSSSEWRRRDEDQARRRLFELFTPSSPAASGGDALLDALRAVGRSDGIEIRAPSGVSNPSEVPPSVHDLLYESGVRARRVRLSPEDRWWRGDSGAMLAFRREGGRPVALLPGASGRYRLYDPKNGRSSPVRRADAETLGADAYVLYRPLPDDAPVDMRTLLANGVSGKSAPDIARLVLAGLASSVLALAPAAGIGLLVGHVIPSGSGGQLLQFGLLLALVAFTAALAHVLRGTAVMRIEGRLAAALTAALWDRLLRLKTRFYREYSSGEVSMRALAFQALRDRISGATGTALLSAPFLIPSIAFVFFYDAMLGWLSIGIGLAALAVAVAFGAAQRAPQRERFRQERLLAGHLLQLFGCVNKLQAAGAEGSARASWARRYREQKLADIRIGVLNEHLNAFSAALPPLAAAVLFAAVVHAPEGGGPGVGGFLVIYIASMVFYASIAALGAALEAIASVAPACEQVLPILDGSPDTGRGSGPPVALDGGFRFDTVSFRYEDDGPLILDRVTIHAKPSEFVAIVGESGSGKSTLVRLALGLETPAGGAVYYDDRDLAHLDPVSVRRQVGAVLQDGSVQLGTVLDNIIGLDEILTMDDAWRAARQAAVDRDIAMMPLEMLTSMGERASAVSGGQSQRIRVAAALVRNPRIVFLDEATNWLDRKSQAALMESIRNSAATRIVIAHRVSTIREAHRIYVLEAGRVVQVGRFDELAGQDGPFRELVRRQMS